MLIADGDKRNVEFGMRGPGRQLKRTVGPLRRDGMQVGRLLVAPLMVGLVAPAGAQARRRSVELRAGAAMSGPARRWRAKHGPGWVVVALRRW